MKNQSKLNLRIFHLTIVDRSLDHNDIQVLTGFDLSHLQGLYLSNNNLQ